MKINVIFFFNLILLSFQRKKKQKESIKMKKNFPSCKEQNATLKIFAYLFSTSKKVILNTWREEKVDGQINKSEKHL